MHVFHHLCSDERTGSDSSRNVYASVPMPNTAELPARSERTILGWYKIAQHSVTKTQPTYSSTLLCSPSDMSPVPPGVYNICLPRNQALTFSGGQILMFPHSEKGMGDSQLVRDAECTSNSKQLIISSLTPQWDVRPGFNGGFILGNVGRSDYVGFQGDPSSNPILESQLQPFEFQAEATNDKRAFKQVILLPIIKPR
jgi:hypothetical protein